MLFPGATEDRVTSVDLEMVDSGLPAVVWTGLSPTGAAEGGALTPPRPGMRLLGEHTHEVFTRPHLRGHRVGGPAGDTSAGGDWSTRFATFSIREQGDTLRIEAEDEQAGLALVAELQSTSGGALRGRHTLTNTGPGHYALEGLEVVLPVPDDHLDVLDFTGRHEGERTPQRHTVTDGLWLRETREGRPGLGSPTMLVAGTPHFTTAHGTVLGVHVAWSGNSVLRLERDAATGTTLGGGELLQPGEVFLDQGESYRTPWVMFAAAEDGLDGLAAVWHAYLRSLPAHPDSQPVVLNVWEAVWFDHDAQRLRQIADRAAAVGVERFVLDDGWFLGRRHDRAGLGDWKVDPDVWPEGLDPLIEHVRGLGMEFGLWFEPEMVNPDSDLYREHPDWILSTGDRVPVLHRNQLALDLTRPDAWQLVHDRMHAILSDHAIDYVKWDHNRELLEAGSGRRAGAAAVHEQTLAFYRLLDSLREAHPQVAWESCASGGGRIDLGVLERTQRVWPSDMTDALARQHIQRWTAQLVPPEYLGAHVSSPRAHATGRSLSLDFRAATAMFGALGIEWDLTTATEQELESLASWVSRYKRFRRLLHTGRVVRPESPDPAVLLHGVVAADGQEALLAHVQLDESASNRGVTVRPPGLRPEVRYRLRWEGPVDHAAVSRSAALPEEGPAGALEIPGDVLSTRGFWIPRRRPETVTLVHVQRVDGEARARR